MTVFSEPIRFIPDAVWAIKPPHLIWLVPNYIQLDKSKEKIVRSSLPENKYSEVMYINANT